MSNIFTKGLDKDDQKEGIFKRLENINDKNQELLNVFSSANKIVRVLKMRVSIIMTIRLIFTIFTEALKILKECH